MDIEGINPLEDPGAYFNYYETVRRRKEFDQFMGRWICNTSFRLVFIIIIAALYGSQADKNCGVNYNAFVLSDLFLKSSIVILRFIPLMMGKYYQ
jgi:hypothetical protein